MRQQKPITIKIKTRNAENTSKLHACFDCTDWDALMTDDGTIDEWTDAVTSYIKFCCDLCSEEKQVQIFHNNKPWITKRAKYYINMKKIAHMKGDKNSQRKAEKELKRIIKEEKNVYKQKMENNMRNANASGAWRMIREMGGIDNKKVNRCDKNDVDADELNEFYCRFDTGSNNITLPHTNTTTDDTSSSLEITQDVVQLVLKTCKKNKAPGPDGLQGDILSNYHEQLSIPFQLIYQRSVDEQTIPTQWKTSTIIPIPKKNPPKRLNDFRPVALTSIAMKCLERIMKCELVNRAYDKRILDTHQFAYRHQLSAEDALLTSVDLISSHLDTSPSNYCRILYADFSSAFNAMNTDILIQKLHTLNFPLYLINWYHDFLVNRPQNVKLGSKISETKSLSNGCPQGCVSSPLLYIIYTNDCTSGKSNCHIIKYADDTAIIGLMSDGESENAYHQQIDNFRSWCVDNRLELNVSKTKEQFFDFRQHKTDMKTAQIENKDVESVNSFKYLGIIIDQDLRFTTHAISLHKKCTQRLYILRKLRSFNVSKKTLKQVYNALVLSVLTYGIAVWYGACPLRTKCKLQRIVREAAKIINIPLDSLDSIYKRNIGKKAFSIAQNKTHPLHPKFDPLRSGSRYREIKCRTNRYKNTFMPTAIKEINQTSKR